MFTTIGSAIGAPQHRIQAYPSLMTAVAPSAPNNRVVAAQQSEKADVEARDAAADAMKRFLKSMGLELRQEFRFQKLDRDSSGALSAREMSRMAPQLPPNSRYDVFQDEIGSVDRLLAARRVVNGG